MRRYLINSISNMRDVGGYITIDGHFLKEKNIIRSNCPDNLTSSDINFLKKMGIKNIIDLRNNIEIKDKPSSFINNSDFNYYNLELTGGRNILKTSKYVPILYFNTVQENKKIFYKFFRILKNENGGTLYYCSAGKDRTGVLTALIQMLFNIDEKDIIADYLLSSVYLKDILNKYIKESNDKKIKDIIIPKQEYMEKFLELFKEKYSTIENYMNEIGIQNNDIESIRKRYLK